MKSLDAVVEVLKKIEDALVDLGTIEVDPSLTTTLEKIESRLADISERLK